MVLFYLFNLFFISFISKDERPQGQEMADEEYEMMDGR
jgi:hypothetical protein